jgi:hypothetical protein
MSSTELVIAWMAAYLFAGSIVTAVAHSAVPCESEDRAGSFVGITLFWPILLAIVALFLAGRIYVKFIDLMASIIKPTVEMMMKGLRR